MAGVRERPAVRARKQEQADEGRSHDPNLRRESGGHHEAGVVRGRRDLHAPSEASLTIEDTERATVERRGDDPAERLLHVVRTVGDSGRAEHPAVLQRVDAKRPILSARHVRVRTEERDVLRRRTGRETSQNVTATAVVDREGGEELEYLVGEAGRGRPIDGPDQGFTLFTAGIALQVTGEGRGYEEGLRHVVGLGGDTDTNAAVAGALLGAAGGVDVIPTAWLDVLADREALQAEASALAALS